MLGAIIGDIVGSRFEFNPTNDYNFKFLSKECSFTDDTICTIAVADALLKGRDFGESIHEWCRKYPSPMGGYGISFRKWVLSDTPKPYNSFGNGAAMRVSPVAYWYKDEDEVLDAAAATALPTHNHDEGIKGAQTVALAIFKAMQFNRHNYQNAAVHIDEILKACVDFSGYDINMPKSSVLNRFDETCQGTVPVALKIISMATCYEDAVRLAVSLGADADTLGAIVGSIAQAIWGMPSKYLSWGLLQDYLTSEMLQVVDGFDMSLPGISKTLIDTTFSETNFSEAAWDLLYDTEGKEEVERMKNELSKAKAEKRRMMAERGKARFTW